MLDEKQGYVDGLYDVCFKLEKAASGVVLDKDMEHIIKTQELLFKRQLKQYSSKVRCLCCTYSSVSDALLFTVFLQFS